MLVPPGVGPPEPFVVNTHNEFCFGYIMTDQGGIDGSKVWPTASKAFFYPFMILNPRTYKATGLLNGATVSGNFDIGVYGATGVRMFSTGSTAQTPINVTQTVTLAAPFWVLQPGEYFLALAIDNITATVIGLTSGTVQVNRAAGHRELASAFPLPASAAAWVGTTNAIVPFFGISELATL